MRRVLVILGSVFLVLIVLVVAVAFISIPLKRESKAYVEAAVPVIFGEWNENALKERLSPEFRRSFSDEQLDNVFRRLPKLGKLKHLNEPICRIGQRRLRLFITLLSNDQSRTAICQTNAVFDTGPATIVLQLIKHGKQWQIAGYTVISKALHQK